MAKSTRQFEELTIVLFGSLGSGKSSTGNSILGSKRFITGTGTKAITLKVEPAEFEYGKTMRIRVIDTPGLHEPLDFSKIKADIDRNPPKDNVTYALVIKVGRYTNEEKQLIEEIFKKNKALLKNSLIIFTNRDELNDEENQYDREIKAWVEKNDSLVALIKTYKLKYRAIENRRQQKDEIDLQVRDLISAICEEDQSANSITVSDSKKKKKKFICVSKEQMGKRFGECGNEFYDEQFTIQKNFDDY